MIAIAVMLLSAGLIIGAIGVVFLTFKVRDLERRLDVTTKNLSRVIDLLQIGFAGKCPCGSGKPAKECCHRY